MNRETFQKMKEDLEAVTGIATVAVGLEETVNNPDNFPLIRILIDDYTPGEEMTHRYATVSVYFGLMLMEFDDTDKLDIYGASLDMCNEIIKIMEASYQGYSAIWTGTEFDNDQFPEYRVGVARFNVKTPC